MDGRAKDEDWWLAKGANDDYKISLYFSIGGLFLADLGVVTSCLNLVHVQLLMD